MYIVLNKLLEPGLSILYPMDKAREVIIFFVKNIFRHAAHFSHLFSLENYGYYNHIYLKQSKTMPGEDTHRVVGEKLYANDFQIT